MLMGDAQPGFLRACSPVQREEPDYFPQLVLGGPCIKVIDVEPGRHAVVPVSLDECTHLVGPASAVADERTPGGVRHAGSEANGGVGSMVLASVVTRATLSGWSGKASRTAAVTSRSERSEYVQP